MPASHHSLSLTPLRLSPAWRCFLLWQLALPSLSFCPKAPTPCFPSGGKSSSPICLAWTGSRPRLNRAPPSFPSCGIPATLPSGRHRHRPKAHRGQHRQTGAKLILSVSKGPNTITVPDLKSQNRSDAIQTLRDAGFTVSVDYIRNDPTLQADTVILQSPAAGTALEAGDCITLTVARAVPDPFRQVPSLLGMSVAEARRRLAIVELLPTLTPSNLTEGTITAQDPLPAPFAPQRPCAARCKIVYRSIVQNQFSLEKSKKILDFPLPYAIINKT